MARGMPTTTEIQNGDKTTALTQSKAGSYSVLVLPFLKGMDIKLQGVVEDVSADVPAHLRRSVGLLNLYRHHSLRKTATYLQRKVIVGATVIVATAIFTAIELTSQTSIVFSALISIMISIIISVLSMILISEKKMFPSCMLLHEVQDDIGWEWTLWHSCEILHKSCISIPDCISRILPRLSTSYLSIDGGTSIHISQTLSVTVYQILGDMDSASMFDLASSLWDIAMEADAASKARKPLPVLALRGETQELLSRVANALDIPEETSEPTTELIRSV